jgi:hypothetical protein
MAGDGLRMGSDEPAEFPTDIKEVVAMFEARWWEDPPQHFRGR